MSRSLQDRAAKDGVGSAADRPEISPVLRALPLLKAAYPGLLLMTDLCLCGYTDHGHW